jgi:hypothetical protein
MRVWMALLAGVVFSALLILDPTALAQLGYACATGQCGIQPRDLALGASAVVALWAVVYSLGAWRRSVRRKKIARAKPVATPKRPRAKAATTPPRPRKPRATTATRRTKQGTDR